MRGDSVTAAELSALLTKEEFGKLKASASEESIQEITAMTPLEATQAILELQRTVRELTARLDEWTEIQETQSPAAARPVEQLPVPTPTTLPIASRTRRKRKKPIWKRWF